MARKTVTPDTNRPKEPEISGKRKVEITGILLMVIGLLLSLSIVTYKAEDYAVISETGIGSIFKPDPVATGRIGNGLGVAGAYLSHALVRQFFGYFSLFLALIIMKLGWNTFRHRDVRSLQWPILLALSGMVLLATFSAWFILRFDIPFDAWSGSAGLALAQVMLTITGSIGSFILLVAFSLVLLLLVIDRDIQASVDRLRDWMDRFKVWLEAKQIDRKRNKEARAVQKSEERQRTISEDNDARMRAPRVKDTNATENAQNGRSDDAVRNSPTDTSQIAHSPVTLTPEEIVRASAEKEARRRREEDEEANQKFLPDRALLDKTDGGSREELDRSKDDFGGADDSASNGFPDEDIEIRVMVGEEEEQAREKDLERVQREQDTPVIRYKFPTIDLMDNPPNEGNEVDFEEIQENKLIILDKLKRHGIEIVGIEAIVGPTVTLYELQPAPDVKISKIESYANDLKMAMATHGLRIIAPIPGKSAVGIEVPNRKRETVFIKQLINTRKFVETKMNLPVAFGKTIENEVYMVDLTTMPHLLIAGATGSGKSVGINTIITCLLYKCHPENLKFVLVDPKKIELALYRHLQKHFLATMPGAEEPIITDTSKVMEALTSVCKEMDNRYDLLKMGLVRDIRAYNEKFKQGELETELGHRHLPYIVVIIDELADLMLTAGKAIEEPIARIAQLARAVGIHLVVATQRPSVNVITGTIKANFPVRIAYQVASKIDSRTILDTMGADQLVGRGDMLISTGGRMVRVQNAFVSTEEVERINAFIGNQIGYNNPYYLPEVEDANGADSGIPDLDDRDDLFEEAAKVVVLHQQGSVSLIQRKLKLGYNRAGRIIDQLYATGIVGPYQGSTAREVLIADEDELYEHLQNLGN
jgi:DNA segregation ATPase FtsK/SpoIIIE, S-DNA-T family